MASKTALGAVAIAALVVVAAAAVLTMGADPDGVDELEYTDEDAGDTSEDTSDETSSDSTAEEDASDDGASDEDASDETSGDTSDGATEEDSSDENAADGTAEEDASDGTSGEDASDGTSEEGSSDDASGEEAGDETSDGSTAASSYTLEYDASVVTCTETVVDGETVIAFTDATADVEVTISGTLYGSIYVDIGDGYEFKLTLNGVVIESCNEAPVAFISADKATVSAKKGTVNCIYDYRDEVTDDDAISSSVYATMDLDVQGKGALTVYSENNNGIHSKDDLDVKNLTLTVQCVDNALKGNDSVTINSGTIVLIATQGDGIKTTNTEQKTKTDGTVKQEGVVTICSDEGDLVLTIYAAYDGIDASYDVVIYESEGTVTLTIYTDSYSDYSAYATSVSDTLYVVVGDASYYYSICFSDSAGSTSWVDLDLDDDGTCAVTMPDGYAYITVYVYEDSADTGQSSTYYAVSDTEAINTSRDTVSITLDGTEVSVKWYTSYTYYIGAVSIPGGFSWTNPFNQGGTTDPNADSSTSTGTSYSAKGIKGDNSVTISGGTVVIQSTDDAVHSNGDVYISGGTVTITTGDDAVHADGSVEISGGTVDVLSCYEGVEGSTVSVSGGTVSVVSSDDGINSTATSGTGITISGGYVYLYAGGDGIDSNTYSSGVGLIMSGGDVVSISTSSSNSPIDTENGYTYTGGRLLGVSLYEAMAYTEAVNCSNFSSVGVAARASSGLSSGTCITVTVDGTVEAILEMPTSLSSALVIYLGSSSASLSLSSSASGLDGNGVYWS